MPDGELIEADYEDGDTILDVVIEHDIEIEGSIRVVLPHPCVCVCYWRDVSAPFPHTVHQYLAAASDS